ncbi:SseB family protein [uncultured Methanobrevibacter sp.]|uniref:SseB family protein n=1 Tax=uncultured Methanobrevibacter sp. TaxID=253161 RepID=UPI0015BCF836|nr:SseB family protein [uncultured Methanobrevibacter sp.]
MERLDDELEELESQSGIDNSRLEELLNDMDKGFLDPEKMEELLELLKKSRLFLPVTFIQNKWKESENNNSMGFNINYIELAENERAIPLFTSIDLMKSMNLKCSATAVFMEDLANLFKKANNYSFIVINPFTDLLFEMTMGSFLGLFDEI